MFQWTVLAVFRSDHHHYYLPRTVFSIWFPCWEFVWIFCIRVRHLVTLFQEAKRIFPLRAPGVIPLMTLGVEVQCLSLLCWCYDRFHIHKRHLALQGLRPQRRRRARGLRGYLRRFSAGLRSSPLLPRPCQNRSLAPAGRSSVVSGTFGTVRLRKAWHKQPSVVNKRLKLHHYNTSINCSHILLSSRAQAETWADVTLVSWGSSYGKAFYHIIVTSTLQNNFQCLPERIHIHKNLFFL